MKDAKVSVIMAAHNAQGTVYKSISSILDQTVNDIECIVVDDASEDETANIVQRMQYDGRVRLLSNATNCGAAESRNRAISEASGRYLAFIDSDDWWDSNKVEKQVEFMKKNDCAFSCTAYRQITHGKVRRFIYPPRRITYNNMLAGNLVGFPTSMIDSEKLGKRYFRLLRRKEDYIYWLDILRLGYEGMGMPDVLCSYGADKRVVQKGKLALGHWSVLRDIERFGIASSMYHIGSYVVKSVRKHYV